jgi:hypothetical protein
MKSVLIGGFLYLIGTLGDLAVFNTAANNMASGWNTPPGRFLTTVSELGMTSLLICSSMILALGLIIMAIEYFKKEVK